MQTPSASSIRHLPVSAETGAINSCVTLEQLSPITPNGYDRFMAQMREQPGQRILELGTKRIDGQASTIRRHLAHPTSCYVGTDFEPGDDVNLVADPHKLSETVEPCDLVLAFSGVEAPPKN